MSPEARLRGDRALLKLENDDRETVLTQMAAVVSAATESSESMHFDISDNFDAVLLGALDPPLRDASIQAIRVLIPVLSSTGRESDVDEIDDQLPELRREFLPEMLDHYGFGAIKADTAAERAEPIRRGQRYVEILEADGRAGAALAFRTVTTFLENGSQRSAAVDGLFELNSLDRKQASKFRAELRRFRMVEGADGGISRFLEEYETEIGQLGKNGS